MLEANPAIDQILEQDTYRCWEPIFRLLHHRLKELTKDTQVPDTAPELVDDVLLQVTLLICNTGEVHEVVPVFCGTMLLATCAIQALAYLRGHAIAPLARLAQPTLPILFAIAAKKSKALKEDIRRHCAQHNWQ